MHKEEDLDTKEVYSSLFKILRTSILSNSKPYIDGLIGQPPFEKSEEKSH